MEEPGSFGAHDVDMKLLHLNVLDLRWYRSRSGSGETAKASHKSGRPLPYLTRAAFCTQTGELQDGTRVRKYSA